MSLTRKLIFSRFRWKLLILVLAAGAAVLGLSGPLYQKAFIDSLTGHSGEAASLKDSFHDLLLFFVCFSASIACSLMASFLGQREATMIQRDLSHQLYTQMLGLKSDQLKGTQVGAVVSLYTTDTAGSGGIVELAWTNGAMTIFPLLLAPFMLGRLLNVSIAPLVLVMGVSLAFMFFLSWRQSRYFWHFKKLAAERTGLVNEWVQNIRALRSLGWTKAFEKKIFGKRIEETDNRTAMVSNGQTMASLGSSIGFILNLAGIYALVKMRPESELSPGELTATFWALGVYLAGPLRGVPWILTFTLDAYTSIRRLEKFLLLKSENIHVEDQSSDGDVHAPYLEIRDLSLTLENKTLLKDISLRIDKPEFVAIVGPVGSGKTLFVQSLLGEIPARFKHYSLLGHNVARMSESDLKSHFSLVPQDGFIASTTIRNNVLLEYEVPDDDAGLNIQQRAQHALEDAQLSLEAEGFSEKGETVLGERGVNLSGGQRQRLGLARSIFTERPVLVLDDSLSAIDVNTERSMIDSLFKGRLKNKLTLLITHRHLTLPLSDRVLFFNDGRLVADGVYDELMKSSPEFRNFMTESRKKEKEAAQNEFLQ
jgi:ABC-type multidrug transport system fused ATPase/permease subunit